MTPHVGESKWCIVCTSVSAEGEGHGANLGEEGACWSNFFTNSSLSQFCGELELCRSYGGYNDPELFEAFSFLNGLEGCAEVLFVCGECMGVITEAMVKRAKVEEEELEILNLQVEILKRMKVLKECTDLYYKEMRRIFERVRGSEIEVTEMRNPNGKMDIRHLLRFREKILDVVTFMGIFRDDLNHKLVQNEVSHKRVEGTPVMEADSQQPDSRFLPPSPLPPTINYDSDGGGDAEINDGFNDSSITTGHQDDITSKQKNYSSKIEPSSDGSSDNSCDGQGKSENVKPKPKPLLIRRKLKKISKTSDLNKSKIKEEPPPPEKPKRKRKGTKSQPPPPRAQLSTEAQMKEALSQIDFDEMSNFKKYLIRAIVRRNTERKCEPDKYKSSSSSHQANQTPAYDHDFESLTVKDKWEYDPELDKITVCDIEMKLIEDKSNTITISCTSCGFSYSRSYSSSPDTRTVGALCRAIQKFAFNHIFLEHLKAFKCKICSLESLTLHTVKDHLGQHKNPDDFRCDECGKEFKYKASLKGHKVVHTANNGKRFPCCFCGKAFSTRSMLQFHEDTHKKAEERPHVNCPLCGQRMLKITYKSHKRDYCPARRKLHPVICPVCGKSFSSSRYVAVHMERKHGSQSK